MPPAVTTIPGMRYSLYPPSPATNRSVFSTWPARATEPAGGSNSPQRSSPIGSQACLIDSSVAPDARWKAQDPGAPSDFRNPFPGIAQGLEANSILVHQGSIAEHAAAADFAGSARRRPAAFGARPRRKRKGLLWTTAPAGLEKRSSVAGNSASILSIRGWSHNTGGLPGAYPGNILGRFRGNRPRREASHRGPGFLALALDELAPG